MGDAWLSLQVQEFDLARTLQSGQFFRLTQKGDTYLALTTGKALYLRQQGSRVYYRGAPQSFVQHFLGLQAAHEQDLAQLQQDPIVAPMLQRYSGMRIMQQDLHETILGFILSSQSNIPRIRKNLDDIAQFCGPRCGAHAHLPPPGAMLDEKSVRLARTGYRAPYLCATNAKLSQKFLEALKNASYEDAHTLLCTLPGIGPKVADCICLFALGHREAFPVDVHVLRAMQAAFPRSRIRTTQQAKEFAQRRWGKRAGLAQQYLFQWAREELRAKVAA